MKRFNPGKNYSETKKAVGYVSLSKATGEDYKRIGFKSGLEVHQQLDTTGKLFCRCPAGIYHDDKDYNAEVIRHMRPTLSELGEYDGTALMEFKTRKEIIYRINSENSCTYEVDDTPPFPIDREALDIALEISLLSKFNIVGEVHITRKQYLDGSIPTGFQRTAILGVDGEIELSNKKVRLIQLSIEEDSCREISDIGHKRIFKTDRLGMPLIETVTYPDMETPWELAEAAEYIRFLNRSTGKVRTGIGAGREDVNVSCRGGTRVEVKGVAHNKWIPNLSHNEAFRQYSLLNIRQILQQRSNCRRSSKPEFKEIKITDLELLFEPIKQSFYNNFRVIAVNLPNFEGILSHFTQPGKIFADEITERLKVIACIEKPNMIHSEELEPTLDNEKWDKIRLYLGSEPGDAQLIIWGPDADIPTAIETVGERIDMAFTVVPNETRKSLPDGTTIFERVLPGKDRMYPDTDSLPIPLDEEYIDSIREILPADIFQRFRQMKKWGIPEDTFKYILSKNQVPLIENIANDYQFDPGYIGKFLGHTFKNIEGKRKAHKIFTYDIIYSMFGYIKNAGLKEDIAKPMINILYDHPKMRYESILTTLNYRKLSTEELLAPVDFLYNKFMEESGGKGDTAAVNWLMGQIRGRALGNIHLADLRKRIEEKVNNLKN
ncbi:MAG TPA: Glu-tRNA(Gln) amidotransferase subunit GatE [Bacteroidales bacterium]|nr:Glu-tRNA(Gln) amidotransferase subunit GatE [Bacteroidales bacterium]